MRKFKRMLSLLLVIVLTASITLNQKTRMFAEETAETQDISKEQATEKPDASEPAPAASQEEASEKEKETEPKTEAPAEPVTEKSTEVSAETEAPAETEMPAETEKEVSDETEMLAETEMEAPAETEESEETELIESEETEQEMADLSESETEKMTETGQETAEPSEPETEEMTETKQEEEELTESEQLSESLDETEEEAIELGDEDSGAAEIALTEEAIEHVKELFEAILKKYFADIYQYDLSKEEAAAYISDTVLAMDWETLNACYEQTKEAKAVFEKLSPEETEYFKDTEADLYHVILETLADVFSDLISDGGAMSSSLLPIEERKAYLVVSGEENIKAMPLSRVLELLCDADGNKIEIPQGATTVWTHYKDEAGNIIRDEYHALGSSDLVDLSIVADVDSYRMEMIVGSGKQLDPSNIRYLVKVYVTPEIKEEIGYELYEQGADGSRRKVEPTKVNTSVNTQLNALGIPSIEMTVYSVPAHAKGTQYYLGISSMADEHPNVKTDVYTLNGYVEYRSMGVDNPITSRILNQDMSQPGAGYPGTYEAPSTLYGDYEIFVIVYKDQATGQEISNSTQAVSFSVVSDVSYIGGSIFAQEGSQMKNVVCFDADAFDVDFDSWNIDVGTGKVNGQGVYGLYYMLNSDCDPTTEYYCVLDAHGTAYGDDANSYVTKAVVGLYDSLDAAAGQPDIKSQLLPVDKSSAPYGFKANYYYKNGNGGQYFTVFFEDGTTFKINVRISDYMSKFDENYVREFTEAPIVGEPDPWFRITGANQDGTPMDTYVVENGKEINMDTMYGYGYQTIFINDANADLSKLQPVFWTPNPDRIKVRVASNAGQDVVSGETVTDFSKGAVQYKVEIDGKEKNYQVSFVKKNSGAQLYVAGPRKQEVFLDEYFEYKHDILIANLGDQPLTGLKVELNATNTKLDDYWVVGGEGNDTLAPFTATSSKAEYGELSNIAKICLRPDGEGEIEGTLTISADGQEPVVIELTGRAQNPKIVTEKLDDAVKYVPYSYWIFTNNMYDWTKVEYTLKGKLPEGMEWRSEIGEIYGVPKETGTFPIHIDAVFTSDTYTFDPSGVDLTLTVKDNTNDNVYSASDDNYTILDSIGTDTGAHDYVIKEEEIAEDQLFRSSGEFSNFVDLWLNGNRLEKGEDYTAESGSTRITIWSQTFKDKADRNGTNTLAMEFREEGDNRTPLKRTAQNFRIDITTDTEAPTERPTEKPTEAPTECPTEKPGEINPPEKEPATEEQSETPGETNPPETEELGETETGGQIETEMSAGTQTERQTGTSTTARNETSVDTTKGTVTLNVQVVNEDGASMSSVTVEIHSTPQSIVTDENGIARFSGVEFGTHTIIVKDSGGNTVASRNIQITEGTFLNLSGDVITAQKDSVFTLKVKVQNGEIWFENVSTEGGAPQTADTTDVNVWILFAALSLFVMITGAAYGRKKRV